ncbi:uncharacterized protein GVI51_J06853 [Nakaseomyces glabratus]|uniref:GTPase-activating protein BEM3 n=1 Tax=Candida glabrata (strain ATCC 2001 / BCRC 20586 / JCM 3761 / NBRC 0622 / NRRL Y-65 / CBS 138) TaxID=284593 RepID=Q6FP34_CANGA|nr:uncharacterized protein CAGL0J06996g [Nakaseomyces glabratus]QHS67664.1 uncharacterized protein GVI51_J06853 [Nakaseomyces glabratus]CAG60961.1 unnamed protein product [Nakaseomyces glabratus]|eukprot:XP_448010.1 uncharacterized protein CAGL0J06996g [[Candida] glabrata]
MAGNFGAGSSALQLLEQYNDQRLEKDKKLEHIERNKPTEQKNYLDPDKRASWRRGSLDGGNNDWKSLYDDMFQDNLRMNKQLQDKDKEIALLEKVVVYLRDNIGVVNAKYNVNKNSTLEDLKKVVTEIDNAKHEHQFALPPRSTERTNNQRTTDPLDDFENEMKLKKVSENTPRPTPSATGSFQSNSTKTQSSEEPTLPSSYANKLNISPIRITEAPQNFTSPATSVTYTTSRITISSPRSVRHEPKQDTTAQVPESPSRRIVSQTIRKQQNGPLESCSNSQSGRNTPTKHLEKDQSVDRSFAPMSPPRTDFQKPKGQDFSPSSKEKIDNFAELLEASFGEEEVSKHDTQNGHQDLKKSNAIKSQGLPNVTINASITSTPVSAQQLGSPIIVNKKKDVLVNHDSQMSTPGTSSIVSSIVPGSLPNETPLGRADNLRHEREYLPSNEQRQETPSHISPQKPPANSQQGLRVDLTSVNRDNSLRSNPSLKPVTSDIPLFVQPEDLGTIQIQILSTLYKDPEINFQGEENSVLFSVIDRSSSQEMFKFSKSLKKLRELDVYLKSHIPSVSIPDLPSEQLYKSLLPVRVDQRREMLNGYFSSLVSIPNFPVNVGLKIAEFISTDTVMTPLTLGDTLYEGRLLMRKPKALGGGNTWKLRYGALNSKTLQLLENDQIMEQVKVRQVSLEILPNLPDDKFGTKNGFLLTEHKKSGLSGSNKYYLCTETAKEREGWISALHGLLDPNSSNLAPSTSSIRSGSNHTDNISFGRPDSSKPDPHYVTDLSNHRNSYNIETASNYSGISSPSGISEQNEGADDERESRRMKMRSIFPFKKIAGGVFPHDEDRDTENDSLNKSVETFVTSNNDNYSQRLVESTPLPVSLNTVFGAPLQKSMQLSSKTYQRQYHLPSIVYRCLEYLYKNHGIQEEGIFRLSGSSTLIKQLQEKFDREYDVDLSNFNNKLEGAGNEDDSNGGQFISVNTVSGLLKLYLRQLPHLICGDDEYGYFKGVVDMNHDNPAKIALGFRDIIASGKIPHQNLSLMYALFELLLRINENSRYNKMNLRNLCIVFSPTLNIPIGVLQPFIVDFACIFKGADPIPDSSREQIDIHIPNV